MPKRRLLRTKLSLALLTLSTIAPAGFYGSQAGEPQQPQPPSQAEAKTVGVPWAGPPGIQESVAEIMQREARIRALAIPLVIQQKIPVRRRPFLELPQNPASPKLPQWPPPPVGETLRETETTPFLPQTLGISFTGATLADSGFLPPDSMGAAGPTQFVVMVNGRIRSFNKSTGLADGVLDATTNVFFDSVRNGSITADPRVRYDRLTQRWFLVIINISTPNRILIAVSDAASNGIISPSTVFTFFFIPIDTTAPAISSTCFADYPTLGVDATALYIGTNNFCGSPTQTFNNTDGYVVRKSSILGAGPLVVAVFRNLIDFAASRGLWTPQGVDNYDPNATEGYFIGVNAFAFGDLMLRRISDPGGTPSISANIVITVLTTTPPIDVPQPSPGPKLDALDDRLFAAHIRNGRLWTAHNIEVNASGVAAIGGGRDGSRWYELQGIVSPGTPSLRQAGTLFDSAGTTPFSFWIPSIMVSGQGHAALGSSRASAQSVSGFANAAAAGRLRDDPLGATRSATRLTNSTTIYNTVFGGTERWGDYSYTSLDPNDDMTMWTIQEFCDATNSWGVRVVKLLAPPPATPSSASTSVPVGQSSVNVTITGTSVAGSGFYDPGPGTGFPHINATVSGGVVVNSMTFNSPTQVTVNLNTTGASAGMKDVTITNPDGQSATGTAILLVTPIGGAGGVFSNPNSITINDTTTPPTTATPYPSNITVSGLPGVIAKLVVKLNGFSHTLPDDVDVLLVGPTGATAIVMSDVGGSTGVTGINLTLDDAAAASLPDVGPLVSGIFRPTNIDTADSFPSPAPLPSGASALSVFNGTDPNGVWSLYVVDDGAGNAGAFTGGWTLEIITAKKKGGQLVSQ